MIFAGVDSLIGLLIFVAISILASWLQKKQKQQGEETPPPPPLRRPRGIGTPPPASAPAPQKPLSWEEELKRLLEGQVPQEQPARLPPPIVIQVPRPAPPPLPTAPAPEHTHRSVFDVVEEKNPAEVSVEATFHALPQLSESVLTQQQAGLLERKVEAHLREVTQRPVGSTSVQHRIATTPEASAALALVRNPKSVRSALLASIILGPPRSLSD